MLKPRTVGATNVPKLNILAVLYLVAAPFIGGLLLLPLFAFDEAHGRDGLGFSIAMVCIVLGTVPLVTLKLRSPILRRKLNDPELSGAIGAGAGAAVLALLGMVFTFWRIYN